MLIFDVRMVDPIWLLAVDYLLICMEAKVYGSTHILFDCDFYIVLSFV